MYFCEDCKTYTSYNRCKECQAYPLKVIDYEDRLD